MEITVPNVDLSALHQPGVYEGMLVGASVLVSLALIIGWINLKPWWETRKMRAEREKVTNKIIANDVFWSLRHMIKDKQITVEEAEMYYWRFANLLPLKELVKDTTFKTVKEALEEKHAAVEEKETPKAEVQVGGAFARMSARIAKPATV